jgi:hypothetical protein
MVTLLFGMFLGALIAVVVGAGFALFHMGRVLSL